MSNRVWRWVAACALAVSAVGQMARGEPAPGGVKSAIFVSSSFASLERLDPIVAKLGMKPGQDPFTQMIEGLPFTGPRSLDRSLPFAMFMVAGDEVGEQNQAFFAAPVKANIAPLQMLIDQGGKVVEGHDDTVLVNNFPLRRTANYLLLGGTAATIIVPTEESLAVPFKADKTLLAAARVDIDTARRWAPKKFDAFVKSINKEQANPAGGKIVDDLARKAISSLDLQILVDEPKDQATLRMRTEPAALAKATTQYPRPGLPAECFGRVDYAYPAEKSGPALASLLYALYEIGGEKAPDQEMAAKAKAVMGDASQFVGEAMSFGVAPADGGVVIYGVAQYAKEIDLEGLLTRLEEDTKKAEPGTIWNKESYADAGATVTRLIIETREKNRTYIDLLKKGKGVYMTLGQSEAKTVGKLAGLPPAAGQIDKLIAVEVDAAGFSKVVAGMPDSNVPAEAKKLIAQMFQKGTISLTAASDGAGIIVELKAPMSALIQAIGVAINAK